MIPPHVKGKAYIGGVELPFDTNDQGFFFDVTYPDSWTELNMPSGTTLLQSGAIYQVDYMRKGLPVKKEGDEIQSNVIEFRRKR